MTRPRPNPQFVRHADCWVQRADGVRATDRELIDGIGIPEAVLMEHAGHAVAEAIRTWAGQSGLAAPDTLVVCGGGNNGGDGYVLARHLALAGWKVRCLPALPPQSPACRTFHAVCDKLGLVGTLDEPALVVDAVFGTGQRPGTPDFGWSRWSGARVVAVDLPTGVDADTGQLLGVAPPTVDLVVTIGRAKPFLFTGDWLPRWTGAWTCVDIGFDLGGVRGEPCAKLCAAEPVPSLAASANKWDRGHVAVVAGAAGTIGAAVMCCRAALRAGAGLVTLHGGGLSFPGLPPEVMLADGRVELDRYDAVVVGPGLGRSRDAEVRRLWTECPAPMVVDADGLRAGPLGEPVGLRLVTPHAGEAAAWLGADRAELEADRFHTARRLRGERTAAILKGACPIVTGEVPTVFEGRCVALGTAGSGDVLAGICGALVAGQRPHSLADMETVARMAVTLHLAAGRRLAVGALASEIADAVRR